MVMVPEITLPKAQLEAVEEFLTARARPTIVVAGFEHLTWAEYETRAAEKRWRRLNGSALLPDVIRGVRFVDGIKELAA